MPKDSKPTRLTDVNCGWREETIFDHMPDAIVVVEEGGRIQGVNSQFTAIFGYEKDEVLSRPIELLLPERFRQRHVHHRTAYHDDPHIRTMGVGLDLYGRRKNGGEFPIDIMLSPLTSVAEGLVLAVIRDISERKRLEEIERQAKETLAAVIDASPVAIICVAPNRRVMIWSRAAEQIFGYTAEEVVGQPYKLVPPGKMAEFDALFERALVGETLRDTQVQRRRKDGSLVDISFAAAAMYDRDGTIRGVAYALEDITERKKAKEKLRHLAYYDQLTGLPNRVTLQNELQELLKPGASSHACPTSIAMLDLDAFKDVNDTLGRSTGDQLLKKVAGRLTAIAAGATRVYRLGGNEFVVIVPKCGDPRTVAEIVDTMLRQLAEPFKVNDQLLYIGASAGIVIAPANGSSVDELIANADLALDQAKSEGGRIYRFFLPMLRAQAQARRTLDIELRRAFSTNEFELYFQPQVRLVDNAVVGAEALLRWRHPERGILGPGAFIEILAASPIAREVGNWVLRTACEKAAAWRARSLPSLRIGVNLFPAQFHGGALVRDIEVALLQTGLPPEALELEITENIALDHNEATLASLRVLREKGVNLAFDDFGTGYASLSNLTRYPLSRIKIDQIFVRKLPDDAKDAAIVRSLIAMAHHLGLKVIAEGVETSAQAAFLRAERCEEGQGFLYAKPLPVAEFEKFLRPSQIDSQEWAPGSINSVRAGGANQS